MSTLKTYILGFLVSITLTVLAFGGFVLHKASHHSFPTHEQLFVAVIVLAVLQLLGQLFFFLHAGRGYNKHWNTIVLGFTVFIITTLVGGTLWIMQNLKVNAMQNTPYIQGEITVQNEND